MSSMIRKFKREQIKEEINSNKIADIYHERYGYKPNKSKMELKVEKRAIEKVKKALYKMLRLKKKNKEIK